MCHDKAQAGEEITLHSFTVGLLAALAENIRQLKVPESDSAAALTWKYFNEHYPSRYKRTFCIRVHHVHHDSMTWRQALQTCADQELITDTMVPGFFILNPTQLMLARGEEDAMWKQLALVFLEEYGKTLNSKS